MRLVISLGMLILLGIDVTCIASPQELDAIKAVVNQDLLTQTEYQTRLARQLRRAGKQKLTPTERKAVLDQWIEQTLQLQISAQYGVEVSDQDLSQTIERIASNHRVTQEELFALIYEEEGLSPEQYREELRLSLVIARTLHLLFGGEIQVSDEEVQKEMKKRFKQSLVEYHVVDFTYAGEETDRQKVVALMNQVKKAVIKADSLTALGQISLLEDHWAIHDLGMCRLDDLPDIFRAPLLKLSEQEVSGLLTADNGWHWIKLLKIDHSAEVQAEAYVKEQLFQRQMEQKVKAWMQEMKKQAFIKID